MTKQATGAYSGSAKITEVCIRIDRGLTKMLMPWPTLSLPVEVLVAKAPVVLGDNPGGLRIQNWKEPVSFFKKLREPLRSLGVRSVGL